MTTPAAAVARIVADDDRIGAWTHRDPEARGTDGPLGHWPVGVKDLLDVRGMPTGAGAVREPARPGPAAADAVAVARVRAAGAALLGKTVAVEYGWFGTVTTRNPRALDRSPGGSSSGSAAAVAAGMCRAALGTQTAGSVIRPAAYVGVPAIKLSHGAVPMAGVVPAARSLDSLGVFAASVADLAVATAVVMAEPEIADLPVTRPRLAVIGGYFDEIVDDGVRRAVDAALDALDAEIHTVAPPVDWTALAAAHRTIMRREIALVHLDRFRIDPGHYSAGLGAAIADGAVITDAAYAAACAVRDAARPVFAALPDGADAWLTPAATSYAPEAGLPGDPACSVPFTLLGLPAVAVPVPGVGTSLPAALQLVGPVGAERALLATAAACAGTWS